MEAKIISFEAVSPYEEISNELREVFIRKNKDYGNSFDLSLDKFGEVAALVRISDKLNRLCNLMKQSTEVKDESIDDTIKDMANYCIMWAAYRKSKTIKE